MVKFIPFLLITALLVVAPREAGAETSLVRTDTGRNVAADALDRTLGRSGVFARLEAGESLSFLGLSLTSAADSAVFVSASADFVFAACLEGEIRVGEAEAGPGKLILWQPGGAAPQSFNFDVKRFLATTSISLDAGLQSSLDALVARQKRLMFWGVLQPVNLNVQAVRAPVIEPARRAYLRRPAVIQLRLRHRTMGELARGVAAKFVGALRDGDAETVADLLDPTLFVAKGAGIASGSWQSVRRAFAARLAGQNWRARLAADAALQATGNAGVWYAAGSPTGFAVTLAAFDGMLFVRSVKPAVGPARKEQKL